MNMVFSAAGFALPLTMKDKDLLTTLTAMFASLFGFILGFCLRGAIVILPCTDSGG